MKISGVNCRLNNIGQWPLLAYIGFIILINIILISMFYSLSFQAIWQDWSTLKNNNFLLNQEYQQYQELLAEKSSIAKEEDKTQQSQEATLNALPDYNDFPDFIGFSDKIIQENNLRLKSISPQKEIVKGRDHQKIFVVTLEGTYPAIAGFVNQLLQQDRVLMLNKIEIKIAEQKNHTHSLLSNHPWLSAEIEIDLDYREPIGSNSQSIHHSSFMMSPNHVPDIDPFAIKLASSSSDNDMLVAYPVSDLIFRGILQFDHQSFALIKTPEKLVRATKGMVIGEERMIILSINSDKVTLKSVDGKIYFLKVNSGVRT